MVVYLCCSSSYFAQLRSQIFFFFQQLH
ncbi:unnamed protein product [Spirodela intermedia]|uniref:Uncharacterized protein n=1 Tax=Spirodela intermedia TaxID=51605 RepID=A0A7I8KYC8_SPIIN|nr:unnamed protein product [Spirodela intermedia]